MIKYFNKMMHGKAGRKNLFSRFPRKGQVALILILIIAIAFIFFAVTLNLGKMSQKKTIVTVAANTSASLMGSLFAGYAESLYQQLGGEDKCEDDLTVGKITTFAAALAGLFVVFFSIITANPHGIYLTLSIIALAGASAATFIELVYVNPAVMDLLNNMFQTWPKQDEFLERGILQALQSTVTDRRTLIDYWDLNMNGAMTDGVSRFSYLYTKERVQKATPYVGNICLMQQFMEVVGQFLYKSYWDSPLDCQGATSLVDDNWGIWDPVSCEETDNTHPCCAPVAPSLSAGVPRPGNCSVTAEGDRSIDSSSPCANASIPARPAYCNAYCSGEKCEDPAKPNPCPYIQADGRSCIYDPYYEDVTAGSFSSFREWLGHDDENNLLCGDYKDSTPPRCCNGAFSCPLTPPASPTGFRSADARGLLFKTLWKLSNVSLDFNLTDINNNPELCYWCNSSVSGCSGLGGFSGSGCLNSLDITVDGINLDDQIDAITDEISSGGRRLLQPVDVCPNFVTTSTTRVERWKKGADQFCSAKYPYHLNCPGKDCLSTCSTCWDFNVEPEQLTCLIGGESSPGSGEPCCKVLSCPEPTPSSDGCERCASSTTQYPYPETGTLCLVAGCPSFCSGGCIGRNQISCLTDSQCTTPKARYWHDDEFDDLVYGLGGFIEWAKSVLKQDKYTLATTILSWYPQTEYWIYSEGTDICSDSAKKGRLTTWYCNMKEWKRLLDEWRGRGFFDDDDTCVSTWCNEYRHPNDAPAYPDVFVDPSIGCFLWTNPPIVPLMETPPAGSGILNWTTGTPGWTATMDGVLECLDWFSQDSNFSTVTLSPTYYTPSQIAMVKPFTITSNDHDKFDYRYDFINSLNDDVRRLSSELGTQIAAFENFIENPIWPELAKEWERIKDPPNKALPGMVIYGWRDDPDPKQPSEPGLWHLVKVESRVPGRCDDHCSRQSPGREGHRYNHDPKLPWVKAWSNDTGTKDYLTLGDAFNLFGDCDEHSDYANRDQTCFQGGTVKTRVTRWDQTKTHNALSFANKVPIWNFMYGRYGIGDQQVDINYLNNSCRMRDDEHGVELDAFIANDLPSDPADCRGAANRLLSTGIMSQSCAEYFFRDWNDNAGGRGFNVKFVPCQEPF